VRSAYVTWRSLFVLALLIGFGVERYNNQDRKNYDRLNDDEGQLHFDAINYCSRQLLVPWSIVGHTTWYAPSPLRSKFQSLEHYSPRAYF
jgi:hypothetical protein